MAQEIAFGAPRTEEMVQTVTGLAGASITGVIEGVVMKMAPQMGAAAPLLTWGTLLGVPLVGVAGALFSRGIVGDLLQGVGAGGVAILGYTLPAMLVPDLFGRRRAELTAEQRAALAAGRDIKQLPPGVTNAAQRAQQAAMVGLEF